MARKASAEQVEAMLAVETNFIVGIVWEERSVLKRVMSLCQQFGVLIIIPEVALAEARGAILNRIDRQLTSLQQLRFWLNDIARSAGMKKNWFKMSRKGWMSLKRNCSDANKRH